MSETVWIEAVDGSRFQEAVLEASSRVPVLVDFWAAWSGPCRMLAPVLEQVARSFDGQLLVVSLDVEAEPELARRYDVLSLPAVKLFRDGEPVDGFTGAIPARQVFAFLERHVDHAA